VDLPIEHGDFPYIVMLVYQRVVLCGAFNYGTTVPFPKGGAPHLCL
jgi:hypothetical protein